jgi:hypothetical protein
MGIKPIFSFSSEVQRMSLNQAIKEAQDARDAIDSMISAAQTIRDNLGKVPLAFSRKLMEGLKEEAERQGLIQDEQVAIRKMLDLTNETEVSHEIQEGY